MINEKNPLGQPGECDPEPIDPGIYKKLTEEQQEKMNIFLAQNPGMTKAEALKYVLGSSPEGGKEE